MYVCGQFAFLPSKTPIPKNKIKLGVVIDYTQYTHPNDRAHEEHIIQQASSEMSLLIEGISQYFKPGVLYGSTVTAPVLLLGVLLTALSYFFWWRSCEAARAGKFSRSASRSGTSSSSLPSPAAVLPRWLGLVGGHTLQITSEQVSLQPQCGPKSFGYLWVQPFLTEE